VSCLYQKVAILEAGEDKMNGLMRGMRTILTFFIFSVLLTLGKTGVSLAVSESLAALRINEAETAVNSAYVKVLEAEEKGADVSGLLVKLNSGARNISEAQMRFRNGDFDGAAYYAYLSVQSVDGVIEEAEQLKFLGGDQYRERSFQTVTTSVVAIVVIILGDIICWQLFRKRYFQKLLKMRLEEVEG